MPLRVRRARCETVFDMLTQHWDVISKCRTCGLIMRVDLWAILRLRGPKTSLWNRKARCRRLGCPGVVEFQARAPGMGWHETLEAPWPEGSRPEPPEGGA